MLRKVRVTSLVSPNYCTNAPGRKYGSSQLSHSLFVSYYYAFFLLRLLQTNKFIFTSYTCTNIWCLGEGAAEKETEPPTELPQPLSPHPPHPPPPEAAAAAAAAAFGVGFCSSDSAQSPPASIFHSGMRKNGAIISILRQFFLKKI